MNPDRDPTVLAQCEALAAPFDPKDVKWKAQSVKNNRALAAAYVDARLVQDRLDEVVGVEGWQDRYDFMPDGSVVCRLRLKLGGRWITKTDVGSPSEQPDSGDRTKAAVSDALKRAAVKFGIGRYLYRLTAVWVDYDPVKKQLLQTPQLPAFAVPKSKGTTSVATPAPAPAGAKPEPGKQAPAEPKASLPANGQELHRRLQDYDAKLASQKKCPRGALLAHVTQVGVRAGYAANVTEWTGPAIPFAVEAVKEFESRLKAPAAPHQTAGAAK